MHSATGIEPVIVWPVGRTSPGLSAFSSRSSTGSIPSAAASLSICASPAKQVCTAPNPRIAPHGGLFVYTDVDSISAFGDSYGPSENDAAFDVTAVEDDAYAPPSSRILKRTLTSLPSRVARCSHHMRAGWRCTCPVNDSSRL